MLGLFLIGLVAATMVGVAVFDTADATDEDPALGDAGDGGGATTDEPSMETGVELLFDGSSELNGGDGEDRVPGGQNDLLAPQLIMLHEGDDVAEVGAASHPFGITVSGGEGEDVLESTAVGNTLEGNAGNDTLRGIDATDMSGGAGNDLLVFDSDTELTSDAAMIDGGAGDDRIEVFARAGVDLPDRGGAIISGGSGADVFDVTLELENSTFDIANDDGSLETNVARITDFDPAEDRLIVEVERSDATADRVANVELHQSLSGGVYTTQVEIVFEATAEASRAVSELTILSEVPLALEDLQFVGV